MKCGFSEKSKLVLLVHHFSVSMLVRHEVSQNEKALSFQPLKQTKNVMFGIHKKNSFCPKLLSGIHKKGSMAVNILTLYKCNGNFI